MAKIDACVAIEIERGGLIAASIARTRRRSALVLVAEFASLAELVFVILLRLTIIEPFANGSSDDASNQRTQTKQNDVQRQVKQSDLWQLRPIDAGATGGDHDDFLAFAGVAASVVSLVGLMR